MDEENDSSLISLYDRISVVLFDRFTLPQTGMTLRAVIVECDHPRSPAGPFLYGDQNICIQKGGQFPPYAALRLYPNVCTKTTNI